MAPILLEAALIGLTIVVFVLIDRYTAGCDRV